MFEQRKSQHFSLELTHKDNERYVVNLASRALPGLQRKASGIVLKSINVLHDGLGVWCSTIEKKEKSKVKKKNIGASPSTMDPELV
ncbi:hypothetical protein MJO28_010449 [Puccinia striiformis f. sp. tritici]|uniref:Uncharacterized protein n=1 Tax=Puccinia striiformis f. sp. tritici TaxID=168172 RepID=A0ACC0E656_9BASI|nr:hypothetical protein MJO28_010449 [Puccinia striiformis f. sp. tritici]